MDKTEPMDTEDNGAEQQPRPNILFIITDQHRRDHVGFMGNDVVRTPALDELAASGMVFDQAWVANPVCMPNRSTLMTGRMPTAHGVIFNDRSLEWGANTWVRAMQTAGWRTGLIGKSHLQHGMSRNSVYPIKADAVAAEGWPDGWDHLEDEEQYENAARSGKAEPDWPESFYGFGHVELTIDHGAKVSGHHLHWALDRGARWEDIVIVQDEASPFAKRSDRWWQVYQPPYGSEFHSTTFVTERTIDFIEQATAADEPFVAWASFPDPHHPMTPPGEWFDRHDPADMQLPASINDPLDGAPEYLRHTQQLSPTEQRQYVTPCGATDHDLVRECIAATYGMVEMIDDGVGKIMARLDELGQRDNTIVVFTSDHGDMMGEHGLMLKGYMPYCGTLRVPLVIDDPRRPAGRTQSLAGSIDLASTMLDLVGLSDYHGMQGTSLAPVLDDATQTVRDEVLIEDDFPDELAKRTPIPAKTRTLVTSDGLKYTRQSSGDELLFNLLDDPDELVDLKKTDGNTRAMMVERLADALMAADDQARGAPVVARVPAKRP